LERELGHPDSGFTWLRGNAISLAKREGAFIGYGPGP
jgi:hypothetical protein